jgi:hypothetical protein
MGKLNFLYFHLKKFSSKGSEEVIGLPTTLIVSYFLVMKNFSSLIHQSAEQQQQQRLIQESLLPLEAHSKHQ